MDESCDIAIFKKLCIYFQLVVDGKCKIYFGENRDIMNGKATTIVEAVGILTQSLNVTPSKLVGLGSDGAAVMTGARGGVGKSSHIALSTLQSLLFKKKCD